MFWHKKNKSKTYLTIFYKNGLESQCFALGEIPIKEDVIISKSIDFFSDPAPCYIHRGAVIVRLNEEILRELDRICENRVIDACYIDSSILGYIALEDITTFEVEKQ